jgi:hypothetical protein
MGTVRPVRASGGAGMRGGAGEERPTWVGRRDGGGRAPFGPRSSSSRPILTCLSRGHSFIAATRGPLPKIKFQVRRRRRARGSGPARLDRRRPEGRRLCGPLPNVDAWWVEGSLFTFFPDFVSVYHSELTLNPPSPAPPAARSTFAPRSPRRVGVLRRRARGRVQSALPPPARRLNARARQAGALRRALRARRLRRLARRGARELHREADAGGAACTLAWSAAPAGYDTGSSYAFVYGEDGTAALEERCAAMAAKSRPGGGAIRAARRCAPPLPAALSTSLVPVILRSLA